MKQRGIMPPFLEGLLLAALIVSNAVWSLKYHQLWLDDAQANAWLDWDEDYMQDFQKHEQELLVMTHLEKCHITVQQ